MPSSSPIVDREPALVPVPPPPRRTVAREDAVAIARRRGVPVVDVVVPVYNEQATLARSVVALNGYLAEHLPYTYRITIADNASVDDTPAVADALARRIDAVRTVRLEEKGRGRALRHTWSASDSPVLAYMDVDLSTDLAAVGPLIAPLVTGHSDIAVGTRLGRGAHVVRGAKREVISRCYNLILRSTLAARFSDAQCGFKAIRADVALHLLPLVSDTGWFFDTELLVIAERSGLRIHEVPVDWVDDPDSRVDIVTTAMADLRGIGRLLRGFTSGVIPVQLLAQQLTREPAELPAAPGQRALLRQLIRFAAIGVVSTAAYLLLYALFREAVGAQLSNALALLITAIANTAANRRFTFGVRGRRGVARHQFEGLIVFGLGLALTSGSLALLDHWGDPGRKVELAVLVIANLAATVLRFLLLRGWVFHPRRRTSRAERAQKGNI